MNPRVTVIIVTLFLLAVIWGSFLWYLVKYGEYVKESPIKVAAKKYQLDCTCSSSLAKNAVIYIKHDGNIDYGSLNPEDEYEGVNLSIFRQTFENGAG